MAEATCSATVRMRPKLGEPPARLPALKLPLSIANCREPSPHRCSCTIHICMRTNRCAPSPSAVLPLPMSPEPLPPLRASFKRAAALGDTPGFIGDIGGDVGGVLSGEKSGPPPPPLPLPLLLRGVLVGLPSPLTVPALILALLLLVDLTPLVGKWREVYWRARITLGCFSTDPNTDSISSRTAAATSCVASNSSTFTATGPPAQAPANTAPQEPRPSCAPSCTSSKGGRLLAGALSSRFSVLAVSWDPAAPLPWSSLWAVTK
mmetsp:Transcript_17103/g.51144  ORF Transcript_17103/g.51144 Transcript_17103/m.51144 type:complete len:263 (-) Transcript_17103:889-1677(-)